MDTVERLYRAVWGSFTGDEASEATKMSHGDGEQKRKKAKLLQPSFWQQQAGEKLALILLQSDGRSREADAILQTLGYTCRLAESVLNYQTTRSLEPVVQDGIASDIPCRIYDNFVSEPELQMLKSVFLDPKASYWTEHNYTVEPPSPYFSYLIPLNGGDFDFGGIGTFLHRLQVFLSNSSFSEVKQARHVEMWAHNRPHATGHQFHFDSDNEGCTSTTIRNPICSCVVYLTAETGGTSIITSQRLASRHIAGTTGWSCPATVAGRMVVFDGKVLHGVVPGKSTSAKTNDRRVTVMFAFWRRIRVREGDGRPGAARPFPVQPEWSRQLRKPLSAAGTGDDDHTTTQCKPLTLDHVYESVLDGKAWTRNMGFPDYEQIFQGF
jgi:hypothetical protein